jgi:hypothetical protein
LKYLIKYWLAAVVRELQGVAALVKQQQEHAAVLCCSIL